jgi:hypothetical protein
VTISEFLKVAAKHYGREALADIVAAEIIMFAWKEFKKGNSPAGAMKALRGDLPALTEEQRARSLKLILREWKTFQLERRAGHE